jgi:Undecaprenyl-phosphate galactose phosphotransferase WbaP
MPGVERMRLLELLEHHGASFPHLILIPDLFGLASLWVNSRDLGGVLGLEVRQRLLLTGPTLTKRIIDVFVVLLASPIILILSLAIAFWIRLDSPGSIIFGQKRPGKNGKEFRILKFRTMYQDAESKLKKLSPQLLEEFRLFGKIQNDPRVTRSGYWLRKFSLDEFPQFWNVLRGEMSLVGPRAYLFEQLEQIGVHGKIIFSVLPGITGLWQVSGRSDTTYAERVAMDVYYVRNWSPWLDLYILARTVWVVMFGKGAY